MIAAEPWLFKSTMMYDPDIGFKVRPHYGGTNRFGFNDREHSLKKEPGVYRILILGDSFNWSCGKDGNYTALLQKKFDQQSHERKIEIINAGFPMTNPAEELLILKKFGLSYDPDLVILGFFVGNDFVDSGPYRKRVMLNGISFDIDRRYELRLGNIPIVLRSRLFFFVKQRISILKDRFLNRFVDKTPGTFSEDEFLRIELTHMGMCNLRSYKSLYARNIDYSLSSVSAMNQLLRSRGTDFMVAIYPDEYSINEEIPLKVSRKFGWDMKDYDLELPQAILSKYLDSNGIPFIDLTPQFKEQGKNKVLYLPRNTHWNEAGNELASDLFFNYLVQRKFLSNN